METTCEISILVRVAMLHQTANGLMVQMKIKSLILRLRKRSWSRFGTISWKY